MAGTDVTGLLRGFGHAEYGAAWNKPSGPGSGISGSNQFGIGGVDLFIASDIGNGFSFLNETVFEFDGDEAILDVERVLLKYEFQEWINLKIGRGHTGLGIWKSRYHHGIWLQTTADRPLIYSFEDDGGISISRRRHFQ